MSDERPPMAHLVGSIPLGDAETVFRTVVGMLGPHLVRVPDGETGKRINWIRFIQDMLNEHPALEIDPETPPIQWQQWDGKLLREIPQLRFRKGVDPADVTFETDYAADAIESFEIFDRLQSGGAVPTDLKFQICLATPLAPTYNYIAPHARGDFLPRFTDHILGEVKKIADALPNDRIAIQWDVCQEVLMWENYYDARPDNYKDEILGIEARIGDAVPAPVELGYHLCYGSPADAHLMQPKDMGVMVEMVNGIVDAMTRPVQFFHLPVPQDRTDEAYFAPLEGLHRPRATELHLGLIHHGDPIGDAERLAVARKFARIDGVATECGWGRADPARIPGLLAQHIRAIENAAR